MNLALIIAGGRGERLGTNPPKQFIQISGHPILAYTLKKFQDHPQIDVICVVVLSGWESYVHEIGEKYNFTKLKHITNGGNSGQESIYNGLIELRKHYTGDNFVIIHDAVRPIIPNGIIDDAIATAHKYGNAVSGTPCYEALIDASGNNITPHGELRRAQAPQCYQLDELINLHNMARAQNITQSTTSATLMIQMGKQIFWSQGSNKNIKITTPDDIEIFQAILNGGYDEYNFGT